jgi:ATP-binding cassette subfamily B protein
MTTIYDFAPVKDRRRQLRRTPALALQALRMVWRASARHFLAATILQVGIAAGLALQLLVARRILQELVAVSDGAPVSGLYGPFATLVAVMAGAGVVAALATHQQRLLVELVARSAFDRIVGVATAVDFTSFETPIFYDQLQRARESGQFRIIDMVNAVTSLVTALLTTAGIAAVLAFLEPLLLLFVLLAAVPGLLAAIHNSRKSYAFEYAMTPESRDRAYIVDLVTERSSAKEVRVFGLGRFLRHRYDELTEERLRHLRAFLRQRLGVTLLATVAGAAGIGVAFGALVFLLGDGRIDVATALTAGLAMQQLSSRLGGVTGSISRLIEGGMFLDDYAAFLELAPPESASRGEPDGLAPTAASGPAAVTVEDVSFTYPGTDAPALSGASLSLAPGEVVALVGENGSGKTTLVKLICQLYRPDSGRILWNGADTATLSPDVVASETTVLFQDFIQYHLSALDNIAFGRVEREATPANAEEAARAVGAHEFLARLPAGYATRLGRQFYGGYELSVGEWQRLALARAWFRGGGLLILDEPTASLDPRAEHDLFKQIRRLAQGRSVLLISHRFSSVRFADRIYVLEHGIVTESGTHAELMARGGHYATLFSLQAAAYLEEDAGPSAPP